jgi:3-oxoacyl-[acyl-carrier protein] reductase
MTGTHATERPAGAAARSAGRLQGRTAIVTGARRSIGRAIVMALADDGANPVVHYHTGRDDAEATVAELTSRGIDAISFGGDLSDSTVVRTLFRRSRRAVRWRRHRRCERGSNRSAIVGR